MNLDNLPDGDSWRPLPRVASVGFSNVVPALSAAAGASSTLRSGD